jgi:putative FmdB family regulatory protein
MPIYEYKCLKCGKVIETLQRSSEPRLKECPSCGGSLKKVLSPPAIQFKGTGWYITDYAHKKEAKKEGKPEEKQKDEKKEPAKKRSSSSSPDSDGKGSG